MDANCTQEGQEWLEIVQSYLDQLFEFQQVYRLEPPVFFVQFLHSMLHSFPISSNRAQLYGVTTTLLKVGLDSHIQNDYTEINVLSGDYLSIWFYNLLSEQGEVEGISMLSKAISKLNELKMVQYLWIQQEKPYNVEFLKVLQTLSSCLVTTLVDLHCSEQQDAKLWKDIVSCTFLLHEIRNASFPLTKDAKVYIHSTMNQLEEGMVQLCEATRRTLHRLFREKQILLKEGFKCESFS